MFRPPGLYNDGGGNTGEGKGGFVPPLMYQTANNAQTSNRDLKPLLEQIDNVTDSMSERGFSNNHMCAVISNQDVISTFFSNIYIYMLNVSNSPEYLLFDDSP